MTAIGSVRRALIFIAIALGVYMLHWGSDFLMPLVLALLLTDVLRPGVDLFRRRGVPNVLAVTLVTCSLAVVVVGGILLISKQVLDLTAQLPDYQDNIIQKIRDVRGTGDGPFSRISGSLRDLSKEISPPDEPTTAPADDDTGEPDPAAAVEERAADRDAHDTGTGEGAEAAESNAEKVAASTQPVPVQVVGPQAQTAMVATSFIAPILVPLANAGVVFALLFFFLLEYDLMHHRLRWFMRQNKIGVSSATIQDASQRVGRYLRMQLTVNISSGMMVAGSMWLMDLPSAILLGALAGALRYIPYVGPLIGISLPTLLAIAVFPGWTWPLLVLLVLLVVEVITNMVLEPLLYGASTGVSSSGVIISFFFWGWVWGAMGLLMAMPMTVWIVVVGRFLPGVRQLAVILSDESVASVEQSDTPEEKDLEAPQMPGWHE